MTTQTTVSVVGMEPDLEETFSRIHLRRLRSVSPAIANEVPFPAGRSGELGQTCDFQICGNKWNFVEGSSPICWPPLLDLETNALGGSASGF